MDATERIFQLLWSASNLQKESNVEFNEVAAKFAAIPDTKFSAAELRQIQVDAADLVTKPAPSGPLLEAHA